MIQKFEES